MNFLLVGIGGGIGSVARFAMSLFVLKTFPNANLTLATISVNIIGCFLIGLLVGVLQRNPALGEATRLFLILGCLGGFTTFSTFGLETMLLLRRGDLAFAAFNVAMSVVAGIGAVWIGMISSGYKVN